MKKLFYLLFLPALLSCSNREEPARRELQKAQDFYDRQEYFNAQQALDTLKEAFPKAFPVLKEGQALAKQIERTLQARNLAYCDSLIPIREREVEPLKKHFVFEKDTAYESTGKYVYKTLTIERNIRRTHLRFAVSERGEMLFSSVYYGARPIRHRSLRISTGSGESAQTETIEPDGANNYSFVNEGMTTETVTYIRGKDRGTMQLLYNSRGSQVKATLVGERTVSLIVGEAEKAAFAATCDLAVVLSEIERLKTERDIARLKLKYLQGDSLVKQ
jgi:hypothetical protein